MEPIIDIHTHVYPAYAELAVEAMDRCGIRSSVVLAWHDGFGEGLRRHLDAFSQYPGRFITFGNVDFRRINEPDFARRAAEQMEQDHASGMRGLKVYKALGLTYRRPDGTFWRPNDPELDPIWAKAGELGLPVLIHSADPPCFWQPVGEWNFWNDVLHGEYGWWTYYNKKFPSPEELLGDRIEMVSRHRETTFIFPHCGEKADSLDDAAEDLENHPNIFYDLSARIPELARSPRRAAHAREFIEAFSTRILFGTDVIYDDTNVPTGVQAQKLYQPGALPMKGRDSRKAYIESTAEFIEANISFMTSDNVMDSPPFCRSRRPFQIHGLGLDEQDCRRIFHENATRLFAAKKPSPMASVTP